MLAKGTKTFSPVMWSFFAVALTLSGPLLPPASSHAGENVASPLTIFGSHSFFCWSLPPASSTPAAMTALPRCGDDASARPSSSYTTTFSSALCPAPPYSSGIVSPKRSVRASCS